MTVPMTSSDTDMKTDPPPKSELSLSHILDNDDVHFETSADDIERPAGGWDEEAAETVAKEGYCIECEDQPAEVLCDTCTDVYCNVCFAAQHRKGTRKSHKPKPLKRQRSSKAKESDSLLKMDTEDFKEDSDEDGDDDWERVVVGHPTEVSSGQPEVGSDVGDWFVERAKYIPLRFTLNERKYLRLLEAALSVSEYTDKIDIIGFSTSKAKRIVQQIRELCAIMSGLLLSADYKQGQELFQDRDFQANEDFYQHIFELGRRHKIMNPDKMRDTYGKLIYLLQDSQTPDVKELLGFSCVRPIRTVYMILETHDALDLLKDNLITLATKEITSQGRSRREIQKDIKSKERAIEQLSAKYIRPGLTQENVRQCIHSIGDNHAFLRVNRDPCEHMINYLKEYFHPTHVKSTKHSLAIRSGREGARLSHDHSKQYAYVLQSLTLWREILHDMFHLWSFAEQDLLSDSITYRLRDTGQGLNRVQASPKTSRLMHSILNKAQHSVDSWVGSSVIHMGDHNVPNALLFIDKYTQVYRILLPVVNTLSQIPVVAAKPAIKSYIEDEFGSIDGLIREILADFFRHGFDGSGADNFYDAGSCIDGRLTSAWNWCSTLEKKRFFPIFLLCGFVGFDGQW